MGVYGYIRVSTKQQNYHYQKNQILNYCNENKLGNVEFISDVVSGSKDWKKREIGEFVENSKEGDILVFNEFSRLGRSLLDVLEVLKILKEKNVDVYVVRENMKITDDFSSKLMVFMFSLVSEIERDLIKSRVKEGIENKRKDNPNWGRKKGNIYSSKLDSNKDTIIELLQKGISKNSISKLIDCNYQTLNSYIKSRDLVSQI
jgi:DNA invertase Pin-like site-specific DNA recombinase